MHTPTQLKEAHLSGHVEGAEQTAAHYKEVINDKDATIKELQKQIKELTSCSQSNPQFLKIKGKKEIQQEENNNDPWNILFWVDR